jgi:hypothetical protein
MNKRKSEYSGKNNLAAKLAQELDGIIWQMEMAILNGIIIAERGVSPLLPTENF